MHSESARRELDPQACCTSGCTGRRAGVYTLLCNDCIEELAMENKYDYYEEKAAQCEREDD